MDKQSNIKLIFSAGGTGGHIIPALSVADEIKRQRPQTDILFIGARGKMEMEKVPKAGYRILGLPIAGIQRSLTFKNLKFPFLLLSSMMKAHRILRSYKPTGVIGFGGYASGPVLLLAQLKNIPTFLQEQNAFPGITNKWLGKKARSIYVAYDGMEQFFPPQSLNLTGNPIRSTFLTKHINPQEAYKTFGLEPDKPVIFFMGGSQGARSINRAVKKHLQFFIRKGYQVIWQTGKFFYDEALAAIRNSGGESLIIPFIFIDDIHQAYHIADIVVARAGAISIAELSAAGKACIFVPLPIAAEDHQRKNAMKLVDKEAAAMISDDCLLDELPGTIERLIKDPEKRQHFEKNIQTFARRNATKDIANDILKHLEAE